MHVLIDLVSLICLFDFWLHAACFRASRNCYCLAHLLGIGACALYTCTYRSKLRAHYSLPPKPGPDICVHCCCLYCALCQEYRELKNRGLDPEGGT